MTCTEFMMCFKSWKIIALFHLTLQISLLCAEKKWIKLAYALQLWINLLWSNCHLHNFHQESSRTIYLMSKLIYQSQLTYWNISYLFERIWCYIKKLEYLSVHCQSVFKIAYEILLFASKIFDLVNSSDDKFCHTKNIEKTICFYKEVLHQYISFFSLP